MADRTFSSGMVLIPPACDAPPELVAQLATALHKLDEIERRNRVIEDARRSVFRRTRTGRLLAGTWTAWCVMWGLGGIALPLSWALVFSISGNGEVVRPLSAAVADRSVVHEAGMLAWTQTVERLEICPGDAVSTFAPVAGGPVIVQRRAIVRPEIRIFPDQRFLTQLPESMADGPWHFSFGVDSHCPLRQRYDPLASFDIEVVP